MPKRSYSCSDDEEINYLKDKIRKLERKVRNSRPKHKRRRRKRSRHRSRTRSRTPLRSFSVGSREARSNTPNNQQENEVNMEERPDGSEDIQACEGVPLPPNEGNPIPVTDAVPVENTENPTSELDDSILQILGDDPTSIKKFGNEIQKDLAVRMEHWVSNGLSKETKKDLKENYLVPSNCKLISAPTLNAEIKAAVSEIVAKRDKAIEIRQSQLASALAALSQALTRLLSSTEKDTDLIKILMDTNRILCDCQNADSVTRRNFLLSTLKKDLKDQLQNTKVDSLLFGENFADAIKTAKAICKSVAELKAAPTKMQSTVKKPTSGSSRNLNWKSPFPARRQPEAPRTKQPATTKQRPSSSWRTSQHRASRTSRR